MLAAESHATLPSSTRQLPESSELADFTTFHTGGPADRLIVARSEAEIIGLLRAADAAGTPVLVLSGGSNVLVSDDGFPGTVMAMANLGIEASVSADQVRLRVAAGEVWDHVVALAVAHGWRGIELLSGIPGLAGAAPVQNIGAYGAELAPAVAAVRAYDRQEHQIVTLTPAVCHFGYRTSLFKQQPGRYVIVSITLELEAEAAVDTIAYAELAERLGVGPQAAVPIGDIRREVLQLRAGKGMVLDPDDHDTWSAGSFFKNPLAAPDLAAGLPAEAPRYATPDGTIKLSAAWLIEQAGFAKGYGHGRATVSTKHTLALTNRGAATTGDILALAREIRAGVEQRFGVVLEPEVVLVGVSL